MTDKSLERTPPLPTMPAVDGSSVPQATLEQIYPFDSYQSYDGGIDFDAWFGQNLVNLDSILHAGQDL